jgi:ElaB/YqjD/DUF883 family membrane-anchored ribosome-binding protein
MAKIQDELKTIKDNFEKLITMFGSGSEDNTEYQKLTETIEQFPTPISYYIGNINDTLIKQNPDAKEIITILIPKSKDGETIIKGAVDKNK